MVNNKHIWEIPFNIDTFEEDNDSSEEESDSDEENRVVVIEGEEKVAKKL